MSTGITPSSLALTLAGSGGGLVGVADVVGVAGGLGLIEGVRELTGRRVALLHAAAAAASPAVSSARRVNRESR